MKFTYIAVICLVLTTVVFGQLVNTEEDVASYEEEQEILKNLLDKESGNYNAHVPPGERYVSPVEVKVTMYVLDISSVNDLKNEFTMMFYFRQSWRDPRLAFDHLPTNLKYIRVANIEQIWKPDSFISQEREGKLHTIMQPNTFMRIYRDGEILYSVRLSATFTCSMDLRYFPLDTQKCSFNIESYGSTVDEIIYKWGKGKGSVGVNTDIDMPDFAVIDHTYFSSKVDMSTGSYSYLQLNLTFKRKMGLFMNKLYVPFIILVIVAWLSFWIKPKFISHRLTLVLTILFIMFWLQLDVSRHIPSASYTKAIDVWTGICLSLVFVSLLQSILVNLLVKKEKHRKKHQGTVDPETLLITEGSMGKSEKISSLENADTNEVCQMIAGNLRNGKDLPNKIDTFSRFFYPLIFGIFNVIYWPVYCSGN